ncbi:MAG: sulfatase-like hydrolase/transferase [Planctomycetes bacterium]|nr:sulfatase-like hydrolase/transferase [Planctomycetota bacterium]
MRVLILDLDTLRPDHLGCYGYRRNTSPTIDAIAAEGVRFTNYYCPDAPCLPSRAALMSGRFGIHTGVVNHGGLAADMRLEGTDRSFRGRMALESLPAMFKQRGWHTALISPFAERHGAWWFYAGFKEMHNTGQMGNESAEHITPTVLDWIDRRGGQDNWLLHVNYWDPHTVYRAPEDFGNPFQDDPIDDWLTADVLEEHRGRVGPHGAREVSMYDNRAYKDRPRQLGEIKDMADLKHHMDGYDCGIRYMDGHIARIVEALKAKGVWEDTAVIITSDHGENQGELGIYAEHGTADAITCRIPMIVRWPGGRAGHVDDGLHYNLDLAPTLAELLGADPKPSWDGRSYAATLTDGAETGRDYLVVSQCCHVCQRGVRVGPWMYIRTWHDGFHLFPAEMLFNIEEDPHEQNDLADQRPDVVRQCASLLGQWHDEMMATQLDGYTVDPLQTVLAEGGPYHARGHLKSYCDYLEKTGRAWAVEELRKRHPREFE